MPKDDKFDFKVHQLKCCPEFFQAIRLNAKTCEIRYNDRNFITGDFIELLEFDNVAEVYTGKKLLLRITHILHGGQFGIEPGFCAISFRKFSSMPL